MAKKNNTLQSMPAGAVIKALVIQPAKVESADIGTWRTALNQANKGNRTKLYDLLDNVMMDPVLSSAVERRVNKITNAEITFQRDGESVEEIDDIIDTPEFELLIEEIAKARAYGKSVIEVGFAPAFDVFSFPRKHIKITNLDKPLSERKRFIAAKPSDQNGYDYTQDEFIFECGKDDDFGYIFKAAAYVIYKRGGFGDWAQYAEIFGMPFLIGTYNSADEKQRDMLFEALSMIGGKPVAAIPDGTNLDVKDTGGKSTDLFERLNKACNEEILIAVLGQSMTTTDGSSRSQAEVHEDTEEGIAQSDRRYVQRMLNRYLVPLLVKRGYKAEGGFFLFPDAGENISTKDRLEMGFSMRREGLEVDEDYFFEISGIPRAKAGAKKAEPKPKEEPDPKEPKTKQVKLADTDEDGRFLRWIKDFFVFARTMGSRANLNLHRKSTNSIHTGIELADTVDTGLNVDKLFDQALRNIYRKKDGKIPLVEENLFNISNTAYQKAIDGQFKAAGVEFGKKNQSFINEFKTNASVFAAFKNHRQTVEIAGQLMDENGNLRSFHEFKKAVLGTSIKADYNQRWLLTEYNTAVRSARMAAKFKKFEAIKHLYPNLEFMPSTAANPREEHKEYYGTILPIDHPWWNDHTPPIDWGCECGIRNTDKPVTKVPVDAEPIDPVFDNNPGKTAEIVNMAEHPYVKGVNEAIAVKIRNLAEDLTEKFVEKKFKSGGVIQKPENFKQNKQEQAKNIKAYTYLAKVHGQKYRLLSVKNEYKTKNPDALNLETGQYSDAKMPTSGKGSNAIQNSIREASKQMVSEVYIVLEKDYPMLEIWGGLKAALQDGRAMSVQTIIIKTKNGELKRYSTSMLRKVFKGKKKMGKQ